MSESTSSEGGRPETGVVQQLARDDLERKRFLKMAGKRVGAGVAATGLAAFIAVCGSTSRSSRTAAGTSSAASSSAAAGTATTSSMSSATSSSDLAIVNYAL